MATRNIVPRGTGEGGIGTAAKKWALGWINALIVTTINALTLAAAAVGFTITGGTTAKTLTVDFSASITTMLDINFVLDKTARLIDIHATKTSVTVNPGAYTIPIKIGAFTHVMTAAVEVTAAMLDTGAIAAGKDYSVFACTDGTTLSFQVSLASAYPAGFDAAHSLRIGGYHTLCVAVGVIAGHTLTGYAEKDILPQSIWDLRHRPICEPEGMVWSNEAGLWVDIYLASGTGASTVSVNGGTISDTRDWMDFVDDFGAVKKTLLWDDEFQLIAAGSNEETNISTSADPVTTGGHSDTAGRRMISNIGCEDCCGALLQWLRDTSANYDAAVAAGWLDLAGDKGSFYRPVDTDEIKLFAGGSWAYATYCGSRCRLADHGRVDANGDFGGRGRSRKL